MPSDVCGDPAELRKILASGPDVNRSTDHLAPLAHACWLASAESVQLLLGAGADLHQRSGKRELTALHVLCAADQHECSAAILHMLISAGADVDAPEGTNGRSALHIACEEGKTDCVRLLLDAGAQPDALAHLKSGTGTLTPLGAAVLKGHQGCVDELLRAGAQPQLRCRVPDMRIWAMLAATKESEVAPLVTACLLGHTECVEKLCAALYGRGPGSGVLADPESGDVQFVMQCSYVQQHTRVRALLEGAVARHVAVQRQRQMGVGSMYARLRRQASSFLSRDSALVQSGSLSPSTSAPASPMDSPARTCRDEMSCRAEAAHCESVSHGFVRRRDFSAGSPLSGGNPSMA